MADITARCGDRSKLNRLVDVMLGLALLEIDSKGIAVDVFETYRSQIRQNYLYCQGRSVNECVEAGISMAFALKYCNMKVGEKTWTLTSYHKSGKAVDLVPYIDGRLTWSHTAREQLIIAETMAKYGFECGTNWVKNRDSCHYQVKCNLWLVFDQYHNTPQITLAIQKALNHIPGIRVEEDCKWGCNTTKAINRFRKYMKYKNTVCGSLGKDALRDLLSVLAD